jgi:hypothetical protein
MDDTAGMTNHYISMADFFTCIGHAEHLRMQGQTDMPDYFLDLARRIALELGEGDSAERAKQLQEQGARSR